MDTNRFDLPSVKRSRIVYIFECTFEYFVALLVTDAFLASLLSDMGIPDSTVGIISSIISLSFIFQLISIFFVQKIKNVKRTVMPIHILGQLMFAALYLLPFLKLSTTASSILVVGCMLVGYLCNYSVTSIIYKWGNSFVDPNHRASFAATKDIIGLSSGVAISLGVGWIFQYVCETKGNLAAFILISVLMLVFIVVDIVSLMLMSDVKQTPNEKEHELKISEVIRMLFSNKSFLCIVFINSLWKVAAYFIIGFMGIYKTKDLSMTMVLVQIINVSAYLSQAAVSKPVAIYTDNRTYARGLRLGFSIAAVAMFCNVFTSPDSWWMVIPYTVLYNVALAGITQNFNNITYSYVDEKYYVEAVALKNSISGICGFVASLIGGAILDAVQKNGNELFGIRVYGQQVLSLISFVLVLLGILFIKFVLEKRPIIAK